MPYPNTALSAWQLAVIAIVAVATLAAWIAAVFLAAREPAPRSTAATGTPESPGSAQIAVTESAQTAEPASAGDRRAA
jgi:hypothetical protein